MPYCRLPSRCRAAFNRAAPFRERLAAYRSVPATLCATLQSCRPLSGAVRYTIVWCSRSPLSTFNRAAPFRERLGETMTSIANDLGVLQSCRPLSGAVRTRKSA